MIKWQGLRSAMEFDWVYRENQGTDRDSILPRREVTTLARWQKKGQCGWSAVSDGKRGRCRKHNR